MAKAKDEQVKDVEATPEVAEKPTLKKAKKSEIAVTWNGGARVYSEETHGADFEDLANEFLEKNKHRGAEIVA